MLATKHSILKRTFTTLHFGKGKLTLQKLKDKATIDEQIDSINLVFPDQYGRLQGIKVNAEYFIECAGKEEFDYSFNPFRYDINGTRFEFKKAVDGNETGND